VYETKRLILRNWQDSDIEPFIALNQDPKVMEFFPNLRTLEETIAMINKCKQHFSTYGYTLFACELKQNHHFIGFVGLINNDVDLPFSPCVEIGWRLAHKYWGQGLALEAAQKCLDIGFNEFNLDEIVSFTAKINKKSERLMQKLGMVHDVMGDFYHPKMQKEHPLSLHVLYRLNKLRFLSGNPHL